MNTLADSVVIVERLRDTTIYLSADESTLQALLECDSLGQVRLKELLHYQAGARRISPPLITIENNTLSATTRIDSTAIYLHIKERDKTHTASRSKVITKTIEVNRLNGWQQ